MGKAMPSYTLRARWARVWKLLIPTKEPIALDVRCWPSGRKENRALLLYRNGMSTGPSADRYSLLFSSAPPSTPAEDSGQTTRYCRRWWDCILQSDSIRAGRKEFIITLAVHHHRPGTDILVDAPGARDHADIFLVHTKRLPPRRRRRYQTRRRHTVPSRPVFPRHSGVISPQISAAPHSGGGSFFHVRRKDEPSAKSAGSYWAVCRFK